MPCKHDKDALIDAAASGFDLANTPDSSPDLHALRLHLESCASCRTAFAQEQSLFASMDAGLHAAANAEVPPSLLARVRAGLDEATVARPRWSSGWFALTGGAVATAALFFAVTLRHNNYRPLPSDSASNQTVVPPPISPGQPVVQPRTAMAKHSASPKEFASRESRAEILVPRDQELLLANYAQQWNSRKHAPLVSRDATETSVALLQVVPIQIPELDVKPLAEGNSQ